MINISVGLYAGQFLSSWHKLEYLGKGTLNWEIASIRVVFRQVYRAFSSLMIDMKGSSLCGWSHTQATGPRLHKKPSWESHKVSQPASSVPPWSLLQLLSPDSYFQVPDLSSQLCFPWWCPVPWNCKLYKPLPPPRCFWSWYLSQQQRSKVGKAISQLVCSQRMQTDLIFTLK